MEDTEDMEEMEEIAEFTEDTEFEEDTDDMGEETEDASSWRENILDNCRRWLEDIQGAPVYDDDQEQPDLYSFYEELAVLRNEFRKNSRRSHETFLQFGEHLDKFDGVMGALAQRLENITRDQENAEFTALQPALLQVVEIHERLRRFHEKLKEIKSPSSSAPEPVHPGFWARVFGGKNRGATSQENRTDRLAAPDVPDSVLEGFSMTMSHFDEFLAKAGIRRTAAVGSPFDPSLMVAVGVVTTDDCLPNMVVEEISGGYLYREHILKMAKVAVSRKKEQ